MRLMIAIWQYARHISVHACLHAVYAGFYILAVQTGRYIKNRHRRFKKYFRRFRQRLLHTLFCMFIKPFGLIFGAFRAPRGERLYRLGSGCMRLAALAFAAAFLVGTVQSYLRLRFAYLVTYRGMEIGYVDSTETLSEGMKYAGRMMQFLEIEQLPTLSHALTLPSSILSSEGIGEKIVTCHSDTLTAASGLFIDDTYIGALTSREQLDSLLETLRTAQDDGTECKPSQFAQEVEVLDGAYPKETIITADALREILQTKKNEPVNYIVKSGDTLIGIAHSCGLTLAELRERNPAYENTDILHIGDVLVIEQASALLQVCRYLKATYTETLPYETKVYFNDNFYVDEERVLVKGKNGSQRVTAEIEYTDGVETDRTVLESEVLEKPVTQKVRIGTQKGSRPNGSGIASGKFTWPLPHFKTITSYFGPRWGTVHQGLDISGYNVYGASIVAADGGTVYAVNRTSTWGTGMFAGYGYAVIIDHGGGLRTLYAHCSRIAVQPGQRVSKGQVIAYVGNTGKSTGPHLHFEVRQNNKRVDPLDYLR